MLCTTAIQLRALVVLFARIHTGVQRSPEHPAPSNCVTCRRAIQVSVPYDLAWPLSWVGRRSPQCERRSDSAPASTNLSQRGAVPIRRDQQPPEIVRRAPIQQVDSTQGNSICSQLVPAQIAPANTRPACHHSTSSHPHSSVSLFEPMCSSLSSSCTCSTVGVICLTTLMTMMIHHAQQVQTLCVTWKSRMKLAQSCAQQTSPFFSCSVPHQTLNVTWFHALPDSCTEVGI